MRTKKVTRYFCDHCSKGMLQKPAMMKHEAICYSNPHRSCLRCQVEKTDVTANALILGLQGMAGLEKAADHCPDCILAAVILANSHCSRDPEDGDKWIEYDYKRARSDWDQSGRDQFISEVAPRYPI